MVDKNDILNTYHSAKAQLLLDASDVLGPDDGIIVSPRRPR
jgi:hypothetical protein